MFRLSFFSSTSIHDCLHFKIKWLRFAKIATATNTFYFSKSKSGAFILAHGSITLNEFSFKNSCDMFFFHLLHCISEVIYQGYGNKKCNRADRVHSHRTYTSTRVADPPVPSVLDDIPHHHCGKPWSNRSHLQWPTPSHPHVLIPWESGLCGYLVILHSDPQNAAQLLCNEQNDLSFWM